MPRKTRTRAAATPLAAFTATVEPDVKNVRLDYTVPALGAHVRFTRTGPSGTPADVRNYAPAPAEPGAVVARDFEAPIGVPLTYVATTTNAAGVVIDTSTTTITVPSSGCSDTWLTDLARAANTMLVTVESLPALDHPVPTSVHEIITRRDPIVSSDIAHTPEFELRVLTDTLADRDRCKATLGNGVPVLLRTDSVDGIGNLYLSVLGFVEERVATDGRLAARRFVVAGRQVNRPDPLLFAPVGVAVYQHVRDTFATYDALRSGRVSYDAVLYDWTGVTASDIVPWPPRDV